MAIDPPAPRSPPGTRRSGRAAWPAALGLLVVLGCEGHRPGIRSPINGLELRPPRRAVRYSFLVAGHVYGSQNQSVYPAASLLANLDRFNQDGVRFVVLLGDLMRQPSAVEIEAFDHSFARRIQRPIFNALGNHDADDQGLYRRRYGPTYYAFRFGSELFLVLDGERDNGDIAGDQLAFVRAELAAARSDTGIRNVFLFCHRLVWAIGNPPIDAILPYVNGPDSHPPTATSFARLVLPELRALSGKRVFLLGGDVGTGWSFPLLYQRDATADLTYIATGVGDTVNDTVLLATVDLGEVRFQPVPLASHSLFAPDGAQPPPIETFSVPFWVQLFSSRKPAAPSP